MADTRLEVRLKKRLSVKFGHDELEHIGYTSDVSSQGLCLEARTVYRPGIVLNVELKTREGETVLLQGEVRWAKKAPARVISHRLKSGMGINIQKFLQGKELFETFLDL
jgi:hypothetical protein